MPNSSVTLRPNGEGLPPLINSNPDWTGAYTDNDDDPTNDASYRRHTFVPDQAGKSLYYTMGTFSFPALSQIRRMRIRVRARTSSSPAGQESYISVGMMTYDGANWIGLWDYTNPPLNDRVFYLTTSFADYATPWATNDRNGQAFTQEQIDGMAFSGLSDRLGWPYPSDARTHDVSEVWVDVEYNQAPVVTVSDQADADGGTAGIQVATTRPTISWTYSDPEGDVCERVRVKIFSEAQYGIGGFDPETSPNTYDSGEIFTSGTSHTITTDLVNGTTYKAYVKASDAGSSGRYGAWDAATNPFIVAITPPPAPTLTVTVNNPEQRFQIDVEEGGASPVTDEFQIERSQDAGATWTAVRGSPVSNAGGGTKTIYDYEALRGVSTQYRARAKSVIGGNTVTSSWTTSGSFTITHDGKAWIKVPEDPSLNMQVTLFGEGIEFTKPEDQGVFSPLSRTRKVVVSDALKGEEFMLPIIVQGAATFDALEAVRSAQKTILYQDDAGSTQYYLRFIGGRKADLRNVGGRRSGNPLRYWRCDVIEVDAP